MRRQRVLLASGRESDSTSTAARPPCTQGAALVARLLLARLQPELAGVGGPVTGADPITGATVALSHLAGRPLMGFMVRKEPKGHGLKLWVEGAETSRMATKFALSRIPSPPAAASCGPSSTSKPPGSWSRRSSSSSIREEGARARIAEAGYDMEALVGRAELLGEG